MLSFLKKLFDFKNSVTKDSSDYTIVPFNKRMEWLENYFKQHSKDDTSFIPEYEAASQINKIALKENVSIQEIKEIIHIFNSVNSKEHYDGSGWFDLKMHIEQLIRRKNLDSKINKDGKIELIE